MKASEAIDRVFFEKKFSATKYMLRYIVSAPDDTRAEQLRTVSHYRELADQEIAGVVDANYTNFNASLGKFAGIAHQLQGARAGLLEVEKRSMEGKAILTAKTKNLHDLLSQTYEAKKVIDLIQDIEYIEKAPAKIQAALDAGLAGQAVDVYLRAFGLVFSEKLVVFSAVATMRHALLECKQTIEDYLVAAIEAGVYLEVVWIKHAKSSSASLSTFRALSSSAPAPPLADLARCVQRLSREVEVIGTLKASLEPRLEALIERIGSICRASLATADANERFGRSPLASTFQACLQTVLCAVSTCLGHHATLAATLAPYPLDEIVHKAFHVLEEWLVQHLSDPEPVTHVPTSPMAGAATNVGLFRFFPAETMTTTTHPSDNQVAHDAAPSSLVCPPSLFYVPHIFPDVLAFSTHVAALSKSVSFLDVFWRPFVVRIWLPKLQAKASAVIATPSRAGDSEFTLPMPMDTMYAVPNVHALVLVVRELFAMLRSLLPVAQELIGVVDATARRFAEDCATIVRKICDGSLNQVEMSIGASELGRLLHQTPLFAAAKGNVPYQSLAKIAPSDAATPLPSSDVKVTPRDELHAKELELETKFLDLDFWTRPGTVKSLVQDPSKLALLAYLSSCCDFVSLLLDKHIQTSEYSNLNDDHLVATLKATSWRCSSLADECLFFLRRELHLTCYYHLTQVVGVTMDGPEGTSCAPAESVLGLAAKLLSYEETCLEPYLSKHKVALVLDGLDSLVCHILTHLLSKLSKLSVGGVAQMHCNVNSLQQSLTSLFYKYPSVRRDAFYFQRVKRYYALALLSETDLEMFLMENRKAFAPDLLRAIWRVDVPTRPITKASVNKLDSLLR
ncbi:hypothetical protein SPRG_14462 [Saprolegnia parasitica CBS 223.65]|uniref:Exocyst complex component Sec8 n=1 Tax=Saprolegnia parasitica (strain CBS 223.65) TaxID=695850 RepID=A0A067C197_SAPPC|nr:hypothetical protein SPRG_14462 [Saprolegnia parasitica CBS 223.65]KDO20326.1 hypothetical protein SPRG_14462 [Saprolegnia parasitica CBS 223.65]|eukprot:XP_012208994.1 hypothetical protein SPRG_14462 [Saprolegnia parasitica CBS 223.65]